MEYTKNFNFALPSRDTDDVADINVISENFRQVDEIIFDKTEENTVSETLTDEMISDISHFVAPSAVIGYVKEKNQAFKEYVDSENETLKQYADETSVNMARDEIAKATLKELNSDMNEANSRGIPAPYAVVDYVNNKIDESIEQAGAYKYYDQDTEGFWIVGQVRSANGWFGGSTSYKRTDFLPVTDYVVEEIDILGSGEGGNVASVAYYDENKEFISSQVGSVVTSVDIPDGTCYMVFCIVVNQGYENKLTLKHLKIASVHTELADAEHTMQEIKRMNTYQYLDQDTESFWSVGNIKTDGTFGGSTSYKHTDMLLVSDYSVEKIDILGRANGSVASIAYYDENKQFISYQSGSTVRIVVVPENARYMAFCLIVDGDYPNKLTLRYSRVGDIDKRLNTVELALDLKEDPLELKIDGGYTKIFRKIGVIGDSLSSGAMTYYVDDTQTTTGGEDMYEYSWLQYIARTCGSTGYNFSKGGLSTRTFLQDVGGKATECYTDASKLCQAYFIALGHNDHNQSIPTGTSADIDLTDYNNNADTYYGNYAKIIQKLQEIAPKAKIFVVTMKNNWAMQSYAEYNEAIRYMATIFDNVYVLDMNIYFPDVPDEHFTAGHGNTMGYYHYSLEIQTLVDKIIRENPTDFKYVQFINTEYENSEDYEPNT